MDPTSHPHYWITGTSNAMVATKFSRTATKPTQTPSPPSPTPNSKHVLCDHYPIGFEHRRQCSLRSKFKGAPQNQFHNVPQRLYSTNTCTLTLAKQHPLNSVLVWNKGGEERSKVNLRRYSTKRKIWRSLRFAVKHSNSVKFLSKNFSFPFFLCETFRGDSHKLWRS